MDGVHDLGGMDGYGPVRAERDEPVFHHPWEGRVYALNTAMSARGVWNIDVGRFAIESQPARVYTSSSYYELWLAKFENLVLQYHLAEADELERRRSQALTKGNNGHEFIETLDVLPGLCAFYATFGHVMPTDMVVDPLK
jgi:nitrile hydratase